jgi:hypothetical protein
MDESLKIDLARRIVLADFRVRAKIVDLGIQISNFRFSDDEKDDLVNQVANEWDMLVTHKAWNDIDESNDLFSTKKSMIDLARSSIIEENYEDNKG